MKLKISLKEKLFDLDAPVSSKSFEFDIPAGMIEAVVNSGYYSMDLEIVNEAGETPLAIEIPRFHNPRILTIAEQTARKEENDRINEELKVEFIELTKRFRSKTARKTAKAA